MKRKKLKKLIRRYVIPGPPGPSGMTGPAGPMGAPGIGPQGAMGPPGDVPVERVLALERRVEALEKTVAHIFADKEGGS